MKSKEEILDELVPDEQVKTGRLRQKESAKKPDFATDEHINYLDENYDGKGSEHYLDYQLLVNLKSLYSITENQAYELLEYWLELRHGHPGMMASKKNKIASIADEVGRLTEIAIRALDDGGMEIDSQLRGRLIQVIEKYV